MVDINMKDFYRRLGRIEQIRKAGGGFEAAGALGMSYYNALRRPARRRRDVLGPLVLVLFTIIGVKAGVHAVLGADRYEERIAALRSGGGADRIGAYVLQADPLTLAIAAQIRRALD